jgi:hypothetical protein
MQNRARKERLYVTHKQNAQIISLGSAVPATLDGTNISLLFLILKDSFRYGDGQNCLADSLPQRVNGR